MKVELKYTFDYSDPADRAYHQMLIEAENMKFVIRDFDDFLRSKLKYEDLSEEKYEIYDKIRGKFLEILRDRVADFERLEY